MVQLFKLIYLCPHDVVVRVILTSTYKCIEVALQLIIFRQRLTRSIVCSLLFISSTSTQTWGAGFKDVSNFHYLIKDLISQTVLVVINKHGTVSYYCYGQSCLNGCLKSLNCMMSLNDQPTGTWFRTWASSSQDGWSPVRAHIIFCIHF